MADITATLAEAPPDWVATIAALDGAPVITAQGATPELALEAAREDALAQVILAARNEGHSVAPDELLSIEWRLLSACSKALAAHEAIGAPALPKPPPWGADVSTFPDLDPTMTLISGTRVVAETVARRLLTPTGSLFYDTDSGVDVRELLSVGMAPSQVNSLRSRIASEAEADERVQSAIVRLDLDVARSTLTVVITLTLAGRSAAFDLVMDVSKYAQSISIE